MGATGDCEPIGAETVGNHIEVRLISKRHLRTAETAERAARHRVGIDGIGVGQHMGQAIRTMGAIAGFFGDRRAGVGVGAAVERDLAMARDERTVFFHAGFQSHLGARLANRFESFLGAKGELDRPAGHLREEY